MASEHTVRAYDDELSTLTNTILQIGGLVENQVAAAVSNVVKRDSMQAERIVGNDRAIDELELDVERQATTLLALRQPMAVDLRSIVGALRLAADLERMGDLAANIAKRSIALSQTREFSTIWLIPRMADAVQRMVKDVLDAYVERDLDKALAVWNKDEEVDQIYNGLFRQLLTYMFEDPRNITACTHLMFVAKNLERIADHATNMAETINYMLTGSRVMGERRKADFTSMLGEAMLSGVPEKAPDEE